jgi:mannose-1-phosphate guanylyltransferase
MTDHLDHTFAVILAGGGGTRLWPKSREKTPKQFLSLVGPETMVQYSANRITKLVPWERVIVVTNELYRDQLIAQLPQVPEANIIAEPKKKDTALAMLVGSLYAHSLDPKAVVINCASDHTVADEAEFVRVMEAAAKIAAEQASLVTVGIIPTRPATGFGYIKIGSEMMKFDRTLAVFKVDSFTEKPNRPTAQAFISTGRYFWNANMYVWSTETVLAAFAIHMPEMLQLTKPLQTIKQAEFQAALPEIYDKAESISIDYAISEKADNLVLIPGDFGWNDVGDWKVVYDLGTKNFDHNVIIGDDNSQPALAIKSQGNLIHTNGRLVALFGINDMIVIDTPEILLIIPKNESQDVKKLVERLKEEQRPEYL